MGWDSFTPSLTDGQKTFLEVPTHLALDGVLDVLAGNLLVGVEGGPKLGVVTETQDAVECLLVGADLLDPGLQKVKVEVTTGIFNAVKEFYTMLCDTALGNSLSLFAPNSTRVFSSLCK